MRTWLMCGGSGVLVGAAIVSFLMSFGAEVPWNSIEMLISVLVLLLPCVANSLVAVFVHRKQLRREWLLLLTALWLIPFFGAVIKADVFLLPAAVTWLAGCAGLFTAGFCEPPAASPATAQRADIEKS